MHGDYLHFQPHRIPHHVERSTSSWTSGDLMVWKDKVVESQVRLALRVYRNLHHLMMLITSLSFYVIIFWIAPTFPGALRRAEELVGQLLSSHGNGTVNVTSWLYHVLDWALYLVPAAPVMFLILNLCRLAGLIRDKIQGSGEKKVWPAVRICFVSISLYPVLAWASWSPVSGDWPLRETVVFRAQQRAIGQFFLGFQLCGRVLLVPMLKTHNILRFLIGKILDPNVRLAICEQNPHVLQSWPELEQRAVIARTQLT